MNSASTRELVLTRLWYLIGDWEGTGKGPDLRFRARATYSWILNDHFLTGYMETSDLSSGEIVAAEHCYYYYDHDLSCLVGDTFHQDGMVEHALGHADARGRMVLTTDRLHCVPKALAIRRLRRTVWMMAAPQWAFTLEIDAGQGFAPYLEGQMRKSEPR
jgi:hypothetical protein